MGRDRSPPIRQRKQLARKKGQHPGHDRILIVSEGSKTEPLYFKEIRAALRLHTTNVAVQPSERGTDPRQVVEYARHLFVHGDSNKNLFPRAYERVYVVFDRDEHHGYFTALDQVAALDGKLRNDNKQAVIFRAAASIPCFELWLLLHFEDVFHLLHRNEVVHRLKGNIPNYAKGLDNCYELTRPLLEEAKARARRMAKDGNARDDTKPYTNVGELVDLLQGLKAPHYPQRARCPKLSFFF